MAAALPELASPAPTSTTVRPNPNGLTLEGRSDDSLVILAPEYSNQTGLGLNATFATLLGDHSAVGLLVGGGADKQEWLLNVGFDLDKRQRLVFSAGQLRQNLEYRFLSGSDKARLTQNGGGISYQYLLGEGVLKQIELNGYLADTGSRDLADKTYAIDTATLYELWNDQRRIAGGKVTGLQGRLGFAPLPGANVKLSLGAERLDYDLQTGIERTQRVTGGIEWQQQLSNDLTLNAAADSNAAQNRYRLGLEHQLGSGQRIGLDLTNIQSRDSAPDDNRVQLSWTVPFGNSTRSATREALAAQNPTERRAAAPAPQRDVSKRSNGLLNKVAQRPAYLPSQVVAKVDTSAAPTRLIAVDKTAIPAGTSIDTATGIITVPLGVTVISITGITRDAAVFSNSGQFALSGNNLVVNPNLIVQPAVADTDTYIVSVNDTGGGTTLITLVVSRGSVNINSIVLTYISPAAPVAPTASAVGITGTAQVGLTLTGSYSYADANNDPQGTSTFRWLRNGVAITGATASTYLLVAADQGNTISFEVTPVSTVAPTTGTAVVSGATASVLIDLPAGFISQGGLIWTPNDIMETNIASWPLADNYCNTTTINGQTGWRLSTQLELSSLFSSGALAGQGWYLRETWSSTADGAGGHKYVRMDNGAVAAADDGVNMFVTCVR